MSPRHPVATCISLLLPILALTAAPALPAEGSRGRRVAIVTRHGEDAALRWLTAELGSRGFESVVLRGDDAAAASPSRLRAVAAETKAVAAITISVSLDARQPSRRADVWIRRGVRLTLAGVVDDPDGDADRLIALRIVELLHANLIAASGVEVTKRSGGGASSASPSVDTGPRAPPRLVATVDGGASFAPGGLTPMGHVWIGGALRAFSWLDLELVGLVPITPGTASEPEGEAQVYCGLVGVDARFLFTGPEARLRPSLAGGVGLLLVHAAGEPSATPPGSGTVGQSGWVFAAAPYLRAGLSLRLTRRLRLRANALVGVAAPRPAIDIVGRQVAVWGRPFVSVALGLGVGL